MDTQRPTGTRTSRRLLLAVASVAAAGCSVLGIGGPSEPVALDGWSGRSILCGYREAEDALSDLDTGEVVDLGDDPGSVLRASRCSKLNDTGERGSAATAPPIVDGRRYFVLNTGADRWDVAVVSVDTHGRSATLGAELTITGSGCGTTTEYRGQLMLLIEAPSDATTPTVTLEEVQRPC